MTVTKGAFAFRASLAVFTSVVVGCAGNISGDIGNGGSAGRGGGGTAGGTTNGGSGSASGTGTAGATGSGGASTGAAASCPSAQIAATPLRRLTRFEYANSVKLLLGVDPAPANGLPVDEVTDGFNNNAGVLTVSALHAEKYVLVAEALAKSAVANARNNLATLTDCDSAAKGEQTCAQDFAKRFGRRAFRRPTTPDDERALMLAYTAGRTGGTYAEGIEVMIRAALQSPHFLYRLETAAPPDAAAKLVSLTPFELATRLSFAIWASGPDDALLDAAAKGELGSRSAVAAKARAMLQDAKARPAITDFYNQWVGASRLDITSKSATLFPAYSPAVRDAMARELPAFVEYVLWKGANVDRTLKTLLTSPTAFVDAALAPIYGVAAPAGGTAATMVTLPATQGRSGILTQAGFLAVQAHPDQTSPVLRGKFVRTKLMCQPPPPPPPDADITPPDITEAATARQRLSAHLTAGSSCAGCHQLMDPIGLAFESFDAIGQFRETENSTRIDVSGSIVGATDATLAGSFTGVRELGEKLASSHQVRDCLATQWFRFVAGRAEADADGCSLTTLKQSFAASGGDLVELIVATTQTDSFWYRSPVTP